MLERLLFVFTNMVDGAYRKRACERRGREGDPSTLATVRAVQLNFTGYEAANGM